MFYEGFLNKDAGQQDKVERVIFLRKLCEVYNLPVTQAYPSLIAALREKVDWLYAEYLMKHLPGDAIPK